MNERIRELMNQVGTDTSGKWMGVEHAEEFAKLIIKECIGVINSGRFLHDQAPTAQFARECSVAIERHFRA